MSKSKAKFEEMLKIFDDIWAKNPMGAALLIVSNWANVCKDNGWTSEEFDAKLYEHQKTAWQNMKQKKSA